MNEHIKRLAVQAEKTVKSQYPNDEINVGVARMMTVFAELLVKECIIRTQHDAELFHEMGEIELESAMISYRNWLREHFGVK